MSIVPYEAPVVRLNTHVERLLSFVHVLPPTAYTAIVEHCMKMEKAMFGSTYIDDNLKDMGLTRVYLDPDVLFEEIVEYNHTLVFVRENFFFIDSKDDDDDDDDMPGLTPVELIGDIHLLEDDDAPVAPGSTLATLANDHENIHTTPIQQETVRAIQVLMRHFMPIHSYEEDLLNSIQQVWFNLLTYPPPYWAIVLEEPLCNEFYMDVYITNNFDTKYSNLLQCIWAYAYEQSLETRSQIAIRLAEEVVDGEGMCPQGKMSRLVNVLRGFHPELDAISSVSVQEQLQSRMAVISTLPHAERAAAAAAVFDELHISEATQAEWMNALLEA